MQSLGVSSRAHTTRRRASSSDDTSNDDPTQKPTGFYCAQCKCEFKMGQQWFACNKCEDLNLCGQCRRDTLHTNQEGHTFCRRECRGRSAAIKERETISAKDRDNKKQVVLKPCEQSTKNKAEAKEQVEPMQRLNEEEEEQPHLLQQPQQFVDASQKNENAGEPMQELPKHERDAIMADTEVDKTSSFQAEPEEGKEEHEEVIQEHKSLEHCNITIPSAISEESKDPAQQKRNAEDKQISEEDTDDDSDVDSGGRRRRCHVSKWHDCRHTCGCLDHITNVIMPYPKHCSGSITTRWRHETRTGVHPHHDDAKCPIRFGNKNTTDQNIVTSAASAATAATTATTATAVAVAETEAQAEANMLLPVHLRPWTCFHTCGCYIHAEHRYVTQRVVTWGNKSKHLSSSSVHDRCESTCPGYNRDVSGSILQSRGKSSMDALSSGLATESAALGVRTRGFSACGSSAAAAAAAAAVPINSNDDAYVSGAESDDSDEALVFESQRILLTQQPMTSTGKSTSVPCFDATGCDVKITKLRMLGGAILRVYSVRERATGNVRGIFVRKSEIGAWWAPENKSPAAIFESFDTPAEITRLRTPDQIRGPPAVLTALGLYRMQKPKPRGHGTPLKRQWVLEQLLPLLRSLAPNAQHHGSITASFNASIIVPGESESAVQAPAPASAQSFTATTTDAVGREISTDSDEHQSYRRVPCRHSCGCVHRGHAGRVVHHKMISVQHINEHEQSASCHSLCDDTCDYHSGAASSSAVTNHDDDPTRKGNQVFWRQYTLEDLRDWGRDFDGSVEVSNDSTLTKEALIDMFIELDVPKPGSRGQGSMEEHVREYRSRDSMNVELMDRQVRARLVLERTQKRQAEHAAELLGTSDVKRQRVNEPAAAAATAAAVAASSSHPVVPQGPITATASNVQLNPVTVQYLPLPVAPNMRQFQPNAASTMQYHSSVPGMVQYQPNVPGMMQYQPTTQGMMQYQAVAQSTVYEMPPPGLSQQGLAAFFEYRAQVSNLAAFAGPSPLLPLQPPPVTPSSSSHHATVQSTTSDSSPDASMCIICADNKRSVIFPGCNHFVCCRDCAEEIRRSTRRECPLCRTKFGYKTMITGVKF